MLKAAVAAAQANEAFIIDAALRRCFRRLSIKLNDPTTCTTKTITEDRFAETDVQNVIRSFKTN